MKSTILFCGRVAIGFLTLTNVYAQPLFLREGEEKRLAVLQTDPNDVSCSQNSMLKDKKTTIDYENEPTGESIDFFAIEPLREYSGIESISLARSVAQIKVRSRSLHQGYKAPVVTRTKLTRYEASPGGALVGHTLTLGLGLILSPGKSLQHAFGCTDRETEARFIDTTKRVARNDVTWLENTNQNITLEVIGFPQRQSYMVEVGSDGMYRVDLSSLIAENDVSTLQELQFSCQSCTPITERDRLEHGIVETSKVVRVDFTPIKADISAKEQRRKEEEEKLRQARKVEEERLRQAKIRERQLEIERQQRLERERVENERKVEQERIERERKQKQLEQIRNL